MPADSAKPVVTLQGSLRDASVSELLELYNASLATGCLHVGGPGGLFGELFVEAGHLVHAAVGPWRDLDALAIAVSWREGHFSMHAGQTAPERTLEAPLPHLLALARQRLEGQRITVLDAHDLNPSTVLRQTPPHRMRQEHLLLTPADLGLLLRLDGKSSLVRLAPNINLGHTDALRVARHLLTLGVAEIVAANDAEPAVPEAFLSTLRAALVVAVGPIGEIMLDDTFESLHLERANVPINAVAELIAALAKLVPNPWQRTQFEDAAITAWQQHRSG